MNLIQALVKQGKLREKRAILLEEEIKKSGQREEEVIFRKRVVPENFLFETKSKELEISLREVPSTIPPEILKIIPEQTAIFYKIIPLAKEDDKLEIGTPYPEDSRVQEVLKFLARQNNFSYQVFLINLSGLDKGLGQYKTLKKEIGQALTELEKEREIERRQETEEGLQPEKRPVFEGPLEEAPAVKIVGVILKYAVDGGASDIHIEPGREQVRVRFRMEGILHSSIFLPLKAYSMIIARIKIMAKLKIDENRIPQDGRFSSRINNKDIDFRVSSFPTVFGEKIAIRILDPSERLKDFKTLGLSNKNLEILKKALKKPYGLILATGPTGCGKTTTLYSILNFLNKEEVNITTLEDPVEYFIEGAYQSQIRVDIGYSFATGLRQIVRQDPDIIMVGEVRDNETASLSINAALTGHLVLSTLHTNTAAGAIPRLIDMKCEPFLISSTLDIILAQRLIRRLIPEKEKYFLKESEIENLKKYCNLSRLLEILKKEKIVGREAGWGDIEFYRPKISKKSSEGYEGRIGIYEVLNLTDAVKELIIKGATADQIQLQAQKEGMRTMIEDGFIKAAQGITSIEEVLRVIIE